MSEAIQNIVGALAVVGCVAFLIRRGFRRGSDAPCTKCAACCATRTRECDDRTACRLVLRGTDSTGADSPKAVH